MNSTQNLLRPFHPSSLAVPMAAAVRERAEFMAGTYFALLVFSALNLAHRSFVVLDIPVLAAADILRLRLTLFGLATATLDERARFEPIRAAIAPCIPFNCRRNLVSSFFNCSRISMEPPGGLDT